MSSIGSIGSASGMLAMQGMHRRPDPSQMAAQLFSKLDSTNQGYLQKTDLENAFSSISSTTDVEALFTRLDSDSDGKLTKQEFSDSLTKLAEQLDQQFQGMRMQQAMGGPGGMGGMPPPPPPPPDDEGFTEEELSSQLEEIGTTEATASSATSEDDGQWMLQIMRLMQAYNIGPQKEQTTGTLSLTA